MSALDPRLRVGVSGWTRPDWEALWPEPGDDRRLARLAATFGCVALDTTRFAIPAARTVQRWGQALAQAEGPLAAADEGHLPRPCTFVFEVPTLFLEVEPPKAADVASFTALLRGLVRTRRLGALLARYDVSFLHGPSEVRRLGRIAGQLAAYPLILEVRHPSWWEPRALDALRGIGWSLAHVDAPEDWRARPKRHAPTGALGLLRLAGRGGGAPDPAAAHLALGPDEADHRYAPPAMLDFARRARAIARETDQCFVVAANVARGRALANAFELRWLLGQGAAPAWPTVEAAFPDLDVLHRSPPAL